MPRRKQSNPQPLKVESEAGPCDPSCLGLESDYLLNGELAFGDSEVIGLDRESVFPLSVDDDTSAPPDFPAFLSCKGCGQLLGDTPLGAGLDLGVGLDLGAELYCLTCEEGLQHATSIASSQSESSTLSDRKESVPSTRRRRSKVGVANISKFYSCSLCAFTSHYSNHLKRHMRIHDGNKPYRCPVCPYASAQLVNLQRHARTHTGEKPYCCPQCNYACSSLGNLRRHQRMHAEDHPPRREKKHARRRKTTDAGEEVMSDLTLTVTQDSSFRQNLGALGPPSGPLPVLLFPLCCRVCGLTLEEADLEGDRPEGEMEGDVDGGQVCRRCSSEDGSGPPCSPVIPERTRRGLRGTKQYRCSHCPFLSQYPNHLIRHSLTHSDEKPHHCPHCAYTSSHLDNLKRHMRVHTGEKPYQCPSCSYACGNLANLRRHERIHTGSKPFHCSICGYSCNQSMNLKRHMLRHTGEKPYACAECGYTTGHWDNYKRHQRKHGHITESWDKHVPINGLSWTREAAEGSCHGQQEP